MGSLKSVYFPPYFQPFRDREENTPRNSVETSSSLTLYSKLITRLRGYVMYCFSVPRIMNQTVNHRACRCYSVRVALVQPPVSTQGLSARIVLLVGSQTTTLCPAPQFKWGRGGVFPRFEKPPLFYYLNLHCKLIG